MSGRLHGIFKKRFRYLEIDLTSRDARNIDRQFLIRCILHSMILKHDGYDTHGSATADRVAFKATLIQTILVGVGGSEEFLVEPAWHSRPSTLKETI